MVKRVSRKSWTKKCKKISGNDDEYAKALDMTRQTKTCFENWAATNNFEETKNDYKQSIKK